MRSILTAAMVLIPALGSVSSAEPPCGGIPPRGGMHAGMECGREGRSGPGMGAGSSLELVMPLLAGLDLDEDQMDSIEAIMEETREEVRAIMGESGSGDMMREFLDVFSAEDLTVEDLEAAAEGVRGRLEEVRAVEFAALVRIHGVLTAEQLGELGSLDTGPLHPEMPRMHLR